MNPGTFIDNFKNNASVPGRHQIYLHYEVDFRDGGSLVPLDEHEGVLCNQ
ncbi:PREDICTED: DNA dC-_dU-editing enzyme APOBEC-3G-like, partial [Galeopterus variegatus]|uniref:DNA dC->dU-editing enzyme APOBEC-3G-like n=1 Tax=Galeopterus variegatus TaxID=482537 RepID=A0ABM0Q4Z9_GALVR